MRLKKFNFLCETPVDNACNSNPCSNGGSCHLSSLDTFTCSCPLGWTGQLCKEKDHCAYLPCRNGGQCSSLGNNYRCTCKIGFKGPNCNINVNECYDHANPCQHGRCQDTYGGYWSVIILFDFDGKNPLIVCLLSRCICEEGWIGKNCDCLDDESTEVQLGETNNPTAPEDSITLIGIICGVIVIGLVLVVALGVVVQSNRRKTGRGITWCPEGQNYRQSNNNQSTASHSLLDLEQKQDTNLI